MSRLNDKDFSNFTPHDVLRNVFQFNEFKPQQIEVITRILNNEGNTLGIMPTGGGKTLCFQIPALIQSNLTIVVSPLIALMKDQIDNLVKRDIHSAFYINSSLENSKKEEILSLVEAGKVKLLYMAPESLKSEKILQSLKKTTIDLFVIDEAHCISTWGHNFRPDYLILPSIIKKLNAIQILALTATATKEVEEDIQKQLQINCKIFKSSFDRPNLYMDVITLADDVKKEFFLLNLLKKLQGSTIIFVTFVKTAENLSSYLKEKGVNSIFYHGRLTSDEKELRQNQFISGERDVIVTTIAFGMGIDKPDIRNIIHYNISQSIESYYQEIGRAGRDNDDSNCITLFTKSDKVRIKELISSGWPDKKVIENVITYFKNRETNYFFASDRKISLDCGLGDTPAKLTLQKLEERGAIKRFNNVIYQIKPIFSKDYAQIIEENPKYIIELNKIFSCNFFKNNRKIWLDLDEIMDQTGLNYFKIKEIFEYLRINEYLNYSDEKRKNLVWVKSEIDEIDMTPIVNHFDTLLNSNLNKVDLLIQNLTDNGCIRKNILKYFDEPNLNDNCDMCSHCVGEKLASGIDVKIDDNYATENEIYKVKHVDIDYINDTPLLILLKSLVKSEKLSPKDFMKMFANNLSESSRKSKSSNNNSELIEEIIEEAIKKQLIKMEMDGTLRITKKGVKCILENGLDIQNSTYDFEEKEKEIEDNNDEIPDFNQTETAHTILKCLDELKNPVGKNLLADILHGSKSKKIVNLRLDKSPQYNILNEYSQRQIVKMIKQLIEKDYLSSKQQKNNFFNRPVLFVTEKGRDAVTFKEEIPLDLPIGDKKTTYLQSEDEKNLYEKLREFRTKVALENKFPPYCVFNDETLKKISIEKPNKVEDLMKIKGIGEAKLEQYGKEVIEIISTDCQPKVIELQPLSTGNQKNDQYPSTSHPQNKKSEMESVCMVHSETIDKIKMFYESIGYDTFLEFEVDNRGDGKRGFVDIVISNDDICVGFEVDRHIPRLKSVEKLKYFDIACFVLRSRKISEMDRKKGIERVLSLNIPLLLVYLTDREVIGYNLTVEAKAFEELFKQWVFNCQ